MQHALKYLAISMALAIASAFAFVIVLTLSLPKSDGASGQMPFADPLVFPIMIMGATVSGLVGWPLFAVFGWHTSPAVVAKTTSVPVLGFIILATPFHAAAGWLGSYIVCVLSLIFCYVRHRQKLATSGSENVSG